MKKAFWAALLSVILLIGGWWLLSLLPPTAGALALFGLVVLEVVIAPIPGGAVALLAVLSLGWWAWPLLYFGNLLGAVLVFVLAHRLGRPFIERIAHEKRLVQYERWLDTHQHWWFLVYTIPVFPIDVATVAAALLGIRPRRFFPAIALALIVFTGLQTFIMLHLTEWWSVLEIAGAVFFVFLLIAVVYAVRWVCKR